MSDKTRIRELIRVASEVLENVRWGGFHFGWCLKIKKKRGKTRSNSGDGGNIIVSIARLIFNRPTGAFQVIDWTGHSVQSIPAIHKTTFLFSIRKLITANVRVQPGRLFLILIFFKLLLSCNAWIVCKWIITWHCNYTIVLSLFFFSFEF